VEQRNQPRKKIGSSGCEETSRRQRSRSELKKQDASTTFLFVEKTPKAREGTVGAKKRTWTAGEKLVKVSDKKGEQRGGLG